MCFVLATPKAYKTAILVPSRASVLSLDHKFALLEESEVSPESVSVVEIFLLKITTESDLTSSLTFTS